MNILAESATFVVEHEYEVALLRSRTDESVRVIGDHYGDPTCAVIASDESWIATGGYGVEIYYRNGERVEFLRDVRPAGTFTLPGAFISSMESGGPHELIVVGENDHAGALPRWRIVPIERTCCRI